MNSSDFSASVDKVIQSHWCPSSLFSALIEPLDQYQSLPQDKQRWFSALSDIGWNVPHWPRRFGGMGWDEEQTYEWVSTCLQRGAPRPVNDGTEILAPFIIEFAEVEQYEVLQSLKQLDQNWCFALGTREISEEGLLAGELTLGSNVHTLSLGPIAISIKFPLAGIFLFARDSVGVTWLCWLPSDQMPFKLTNERLTAESRFLKIKKPRKFLLPSNQCLCLQKEITDLNFSDRLRSLTTANPFSEVSRFYFYADQFFSYVRRNEFLESGLIKRIGLLRIELEGLLSLERTIALGGLSKEQNTALISGLKTRVYNFHRDLSASVTEVVGYEGIEYSEPMLSSNERTQSSIRRVFGGGLDFIGRVGTKEQLSCNLELLGGNHEIERYLGLTE